MQMKYRKLKRWKYQLTSKYTFFVGKEFPDAASDFVTISRGMLILKNRYAWGGATGGIDTESIRRASLIHDGLCQLIAEGLLDMEHRKQADVIFKQICKEDGVGVLRQNYTYLAIRAYVKVKYGWRY